MSIQSINSGIPLLAVEHLTYPSTEGFVVSGTPVQQQDTQGDIPLVSTQQAAQKLQEFVSQVRGDDIQFSVDEKTNRVVVSFLDKQTHKVLMQIPSKEALAMADSLQKIQGLLVKEAA